MAYRNLTPSFRSTFLRISLRIALSLNNHIPDTERDHFLLKHNPSPRHLGISLKIAVFLSHFFGVEEDIG